MVVRLEVYGISNHIIRRGHEACGRDRYTVDRNRTIGSHPDVPHTVLHDDRVVVLQPRELRTRLVAKAHAIVLERWELIR